MISKYALPAGNWLLNTLMPHHCHLCGVMTNSALCQGCYNNLSLNTAGCKTCDIPLKALEPLSSIRVNSSPTICGACLETPPSYNKAVSAYIYAPPISVIINQLKHKRAINWVNTLAPELESRVTRLHMNAPLPQAIIPVPLHWKRELRRGFNQSVILAKRLSKHFDIEMLEAIKKIKNTHQQQGLGRSERLRNLKNSFQLVKPIDHLQHVALIDDVMTTGATVEIIAKFLMQHGIESVDVWTLARTPKP